MTDAHRAAADYVAAMTEAELAAFIAEARTTPGQLTAADLKGMTPEQIVTAKQQGRLDHALGVDAAETELLDRARKLGQVTRAELNLLRELGRDDLVAAYASSLDRVTP